jgi:hypothetical protein
MDESNPVFFIPGYAQDEQEAIFAEWADSLKRPVPQLGERIYAVSFERKECLWRATVGERLKGRRKKWEGRKHVGWEDWFDDPSFVVAIFPPQPFIVVAHPYQGTQFPVDSYAVTPTGSPPFAYPSASPAR